MMKDILVVMESNFELVAALATAHNVEITVVAEYEDVLELDVVGKDITEFVVACNAL